MFKKVACLILVFLVPAQSAQPISEKTVQMCAIGSGILVTGVVGYIILKNSNSLETWSNQRLAITGLSTLAAGVVAGALVYHFMHKNTPTGRVAYAQKIIEEQLATDELLGRASEETNHTMVRINRVFDSNWPLVYARKSLTHNAVELGKAAAALDLAHAEAMQHASDYPAVLRECERLQSQVLRTYDKIDTLLQTIVEHKNYAQQVLLCEKYNALKSQEEHQEKLLREGLAAKQMDDNALSFSI